MRKRIFATLLALVMVLGLTVTAGAEGETDLNERLGTASTTAENVVFAYDAFNDPTTVTVNGYVLNGGSYKLTGDLTITAPLVIQGTVTLDLNGKVLKYVGTDKNSVIVVDDDDGEDVSFTLTDSGSGGKITGGTGTEYKDAESPTDSWVRGGGVFVGSKATFNMTGGSIEGCSTTGGDNDKGGGVYLASGHNKSMGTIITPTTFNMTGGSIRNCSSGQGGGVCTGNYTKITISGSKISGCKATGSGGGIYCCGDTNTLSVENSTISGCKASGSGGGVYAGDNGEPCTFTMENSTISNCEAAGNGGGVYHNGGSFTMENGSTISHCTASGENRTNNDKGGGGVYLGSTGNLIMKAGSAIFDCTVASGCEGAAVYNKGANVYALGGSVYGSVYNWNCDIENTATDGSTIFYDGITNGDYGKIVGKRVRFMNGDTLYAETVANKDGGKISQPTAPTAPEGKVFAGWSYTKSDGSTGMWDFASTFAMNAPECSKEYTANKASDWDVATLTAVWDTQSSSGSAHEPIRRQSTTPAATDTTTTDTTTDVVTSAKTFDVGVAVYGAMAIASLLGMGYVGKKRV